ncbi:MAG: cytochrome c oxidase assembly protein, partial [Planctomycetota bacterium]
MTTSTSDDVARRNRRLGRRLGLVALGMVALSPVLYITGLKLCSALGLGFSPDGEELATEGVSAGREITAVFSADMEEALEGRIEFTVDEREQTVVVGGDSAGRNLYHIRNVSDEALYLRPIHFVSPPQASQKFAMTECFCYNDMKLEPGEARELVVVYGFGA